VVKIMSKERVLIEIDPTIPQPYWSYIKERNGNVARRIASHLGIEFDHRPADGVDRHAFFVPSKTLPKKAAHALGITTVHDFYGGAVEDLLHVSKSALHSRIRKDSNQPLAYSEKFAAQVADVVLPGFTFFGVDEGFDESDGAGQDLVTSIGHLRSLLGSLDPYFVSQNGMVLEVNLEDARTTSAGIFYLGGELYSQLARQKDIKMNGRTLYGGAVMRICRGGFDSLSRCSRGDNHSGLVIEQAGIIHERMGLFDPLVSRASYDVLQGITSQGEFLSGVTDITYRLGGSSPAEVLALDYFRQNPDIVFIDADVTLDYPIGAPAPNEVIFLDQPSLRITAKLLEVDNYSTRLI